MDKIKQHLSKIIIDSYHFIQILRFLSQVHLITSYIGKKECVV